jgi:uncharacterized protein
MTDRGDVQAATGRHQPSALVRVRRKPSRARYDIAAANAILDAAPFSHVATVRRGRPVVLPMAHGRIGSTLFLHGSPAAGLFRDAGAGSLACVTATLLDGLVFGRSARNHSMNYRSVTVHGRATQVTEPNEVIEGLRALVDHLTPGRWDEVRKPSSEEIRETALWRIPIEDVSVKSRAGSTLEPEADRALPVWAGHIQAQLVFGRPVSAAGVPVGVELPGYLNAITTASWCLQAPGSPRSDSQEPGGQRGGEHCLRDSQAGRPRVDSCVPEDDHRADSKQRPGDVPERHGNAR